MLDQFFSNHPQLVFANTNQTFINEEGLRTAKEAAVAKLDPPDRITFPGNRSARSHILIYELLLCEQMREYTGLKNKCDRLLVEVVLLHRLLIAEERLNEIDASIRRPINIIGWMIQERLIHILLQTGSRSMRELAVFGKSEGIDTSSWFARLAGASTEANALQELGFHPDLQVYPATVFEDTVLKIDFFVFLANTQTGVCVSAKTTVARKSRIHFKPSSEYIEWWDEIQKGSSRFQSQFGRTFHPALLTIMKDQSTLLDLSPPTHPAPWVVELCTFLRRTNIQQLLR